MVRDGAGFLGILRITGGLRGCQRRAGSMGKAFWIISASSLQFSIASRHGCGQDASFPILRCFFPWYLS